MKKRYIWMYIFTKDKWLKRSHKWHQLSLSGSAMFELPHLFFFIEIFSLKNWLSIEEKILIFEINSITFGIYVGHLYLAVNLFRCFLLSHSLCFFKYLNYLKHKKSRNQIKCFIILFFLYVKRIFKKKFKKKEENDDDDDNVKFKNWIFAVVDKTYVYLKNIYMLKMKKYIRNHWKKNMLIYINLFIYI